MIWELGCGVRKLELGVVDLGLRPGKGWGLGLGNGLIGHLVGRFFVNDNRMGIGLWVFDLWKSRWKTFLERGI